jgi:hypothetical protein
MSRLSSPRLSGRSPRRAATPPPSRRCRAVTRRARPLRKCFQTSARLPKAGWPSRTTTLLPAGHENGPIKKSTSPCEVSSSSLRVVPALDRFS